MIRIPHIGATQRDALEMYIFDPAHEEGSFPGALDGSTLIVTDRERAYNLLIEGVNSADVDYDREYRDALQRVASRVLKAKEK